MWWRGVAQRNLSLRAISLEAEAAFDMGMIAELVDQDVLGRAKQIAAELGSGLLVALTMTKKVPARSLETGLDGMLTYELLSQTIARGMEDHREGIRFFLEKRERAFEGK